MKTPLWIALCVVASLLASCERRTETAETGGNVSVEPVPDEPASPGDQSATPGGTAGETAATPAGAEPAAPAAPDTATPPEPKNPGE